MNTCPNHSDRALGPRVDPGCRALDFTLQFEDIFLASIPAGLFILLAPAHIVPLFRKRERFPLLSKSLAGKSTILCFLFAARLTFLGLRIQHQYVTTGASLAADILNVLAASVSLGLSFLDHQRSLRPSTLFALYLSTSIILEIARTRTLWLMTSPISVSVVMTCSLSFSVAALILESIERKRGSSIMTQSLAPEQLSGFWNRTIFAWLATTLRIGYGKIISLNDLPVLDTNLQSRHSKQKVTVSWKKQNFQGRHSLLRACFRSYALSFLSPVIPRLCITAFTFAQPFLINKTISFVGHENPDPNYGRGLIGAWSLVYLGLAASHSIYQYQNFRFITRLRGGLTALIYQRSIGLRPFESRETTAITLVTTDIERLVGGMQLFHDVWGSFLSIVIAAWLLGLQLSVACLAPILLVLIFIVATSRLAASIMKAQVAWVKKVQERLRVTSVALSNIKAIKMIGLSNVVTDLIQSFRISKIETSKRFRILFISVLLLSLAPINLAPVLTFGVYTIVAVFWKNESLLTAQAFTSVSLITLLTTPVVTFIQALPNVVQCLSIFDRVQEYCGNGGVTNAMREPRTTGSTPRPEPSFQDLELANMKSNKPPQNGNISIRNQKFWYDKDKAPVLENVNVTIRRGSMVAIVGPVGSGKSAFLNCLLGEMIPSSFSSEGGSVQQIISEPVAYCAHQPWLENGTIQRNIIGISPYDEQWYRTVKSACSLDADIEQLKNGDSTIVGSEGLNLSGGQKQRIALARATYSRHKIVLLDDVFSGMDAHTVQSISDRLFSDGGLLRKHDTTVVVATHNRKIMALAEDLIILEGGRVKEIGTPANLLQSEEDIHQIGPRTPIHRNFDGDTRAQNDEIPSRNIRVSQEMPVNVEADEIPTDLRRKRGDMKVYMYYGSCAGLGVVGLYIFFIALWMFCTEFSTVIIKWWSEENSKDPNSRAGMWIGVYTMLGILGTMAAFAAAWFALVCIISNTALRIHSDLLHTTFKASFRFLTLTDHGELLNRFSQDMELIDMELPQTMVNYTSTVVSCLMKIVILAVFSQYLGVAIPFLTGALYLLQSFYLKTSRQVRLLGIEARAPLVTHFTESVAGAATIRAFGWQSQYEERNHHHIDMSQKPVYLQSCIQHWLTFVLDVIVAVLAIALVGTVVTWHDKFTSGSVGVSLVIVVNFGEIIARLIQSWTKLESSVGAVARVMRFVNESESEDAEGRKAVLAAEWPQNGTVEFVNMTASYGPKSKPVLRNISLYIPPGQHIAICGRTGSGKTSLLLSLLQMIDVNEGQILVDGVDLATIATTNLRSRMNAVPQDPFLVPGTIRFNIDPFQTASDDVITRALSLTGLWDVIRDRGGLDEEMDLEAWSDGQRQLLCLARVMVRKSKILVLDEVASSVDSETEAKIQHIIDTEFKNCTVLAVIHRLKHVLQYDKVALFEDGVLLEYDQPATLTRGLTHFAKLYKSNT